MAYLQFGTNSGRSQVSWEMVLPQACTIPGNYRLHQSFIMGEIASINEAYEAVTE